MAIDFNVASKIDNDDDDELKILSELIIDQDLNPWSEFRASIAIVSQSKGGGDDSLQSLFTRLSTISAKLSNAPTACVVLGDEKQLSEISIADEQVVVSNNDIQGNDTVSEVKCALTPMEQRDMQSWNDRLSREKVFSRYYNPERWELSELETIQKLLGVENTETPRFFNESGQEETNKTIINIFFPGDDDPKSVLLKQGPILFNGGEEREMLLFTHGFLLSLVKFDTPLHNLFNTNSEKLNNRFVTIDSSLTFDGTIDAGELKSIKNDPAPKKEVPWNWGLLCRKLKRIIDVKVECASSYASIAKVESINICFSEATRVYRNSSWAELVFAIFLEKREEPLIIVCSKPEHRSAWVDAFRTCYVNSIQLQADNGLSDAKQIRAQPGWQHRTIRASLFSLVCTNDVKGLGEQLAYPSADIIIDDQDEYRRCSPLHYAAILGHKDCAEILLRYQARVNLEDSDLKTPLDYAVLSENAEMINLLEQRGGKKRSSMVLFESAVEEQKRANHETESRTHGQKLFTVVQESRSVLVQGMSAFRERGERLERLGNATANLHMDACDYAQMAKQIKEKNKSKSIFLG